MCVCVCVCVIINDYKSVSMRHIKYYRNYIFIWESENLITKADKYCNNMIINMNDLRVTCRTILIRSIS